MAHVHCGSDQGVCFRLAGELCPSGYEMKPVLSGNDGNFLVRCRSAGAPVVAAQCPSPARAAVAAPAAAPVVAAKPQNPNEAWPPAAEPAQAAYPWASPAASTAGRSQAGAPSAQAEVDLGY